MIEPGPVTEVLNEGGDPARRRQVQPWVYAQLRSIAASLLKRERGGPSGRGTDMSLTRVVHDAWLKLRRSRGWDSRGHYLGSARRAMSQVLIDDANRRRRGPRFVSLGAVPPGQPSPRSADKPISGLMDAGSGSRRIELALRRLEGSDPRCAEVARQKLYWNRRESDIAEELGVSVRTVERDWRFASTWLAEALSEAGREE